MSKIDKYFYRFDSSKVDSEIYLGDDKKELLALGLIREIHIENNEKDYQGINGSPWRIGFYNDQVYNIWYSRENSFKILGTEIIGEGFNSIKETIESNFVNLNNSIRNVKKINQYEDSDVLYIICRDFFIALVAIIRPNLKVE